ncbi:MAG TPA: selenocysteine-specific translation elongation factor [Solirubrobacterales bacterium]|nr:selenocysteine-specific translation elongation factor [Solirubrobacterales bacterium]
MSGVGVALIMGTAGHVDHGKTALVRALTGTDTDRLVEERRRGLSIELGFAELRLPDGRSLGVVDVPGHESLVRTMVAGTSGIDLFLMVIAADEGVMPQTREHLAALEALEVDVGVVALTRIDRASEDVRALSRDEASELLPSAPLVEVSAVTGEGLDELRAAIASAGARAEAGRPAPPAVARRYPVLHVDRSFTLRGIGTVVTGTLWQGEIAPGDRLMILPSGRETRARSVQVHSRDADTAMAGQRVALNLSRVSVGEIRRGDVIASPESGLVPSYRLDSRLRLAPGAPPLDRERVQVHHGTRDVPGRVVALGEELAQLRLEAPLIARPGDRFVLRRIAPPTVIGGGAVIDPAPHRHGPGPATERLRRIVDIGLDAVAREERERAASEPARQRPAVGKPHPPGDLEDRARLVLALLEADGAEPRSPAAIAEALGVDRRGALETLDELVAARRAVRVSADIYFAAGPLEALCSQAIELASADGQLTLPGLRDALGTSRKYAQAVLEHLDAAKITVRRGDRHILRRPGGSRHVGSPG